MSRVKWVLLAVLLIGGVFLNGCGVSNEGSTTGLDRTITVVGTGEATAAPDQALFRAGVEVTADTVREATRRNGEIMQAIVAALTGMGVAEKDIQTSNFSINLERGYERFPQPEGATEEESIRYRASNMVQVTVRDIGKVSDLLDATIEAGANNIWGVEFTIDETEALESNARTEAMQDARARADELAVLAGVKMGQVVSVSESVAGYPVPLAGVTVERAVGMGGGGPSISPGEATIRMQVQVTYEIE